jgi:hypothetical protein
MKDIVIWMTQQHILQILVLISQSIHQPPRKRCFGGVLLLYKQGLLWGEALLNFFWHVPETRDERRFNTIGSILSGQASFNKVF